MKVLVYGQKNEYEECALLLSALPVLQYRRMEFCHAEDYDSFIGLLPEMESEDPVVILTDGAEGMEGVLAANPDLTVIGAHFGGWSVWEEASARLSKFENLIVDCSSSTAYISPEYARRLVRIYGADRVMFGSDFPYNHPADELERTLALGLTDEEYRLVLGENAKKLLGIKK